MAHHSAERLSKSIIALVAVLVAGIAIGDPDVVTRMGRLVIDLVYLRPGSRKQEAEVCAVLSGWRGRDVSAGCS